MDKMQPACASAASARASAFSPAAFIASVAGLVAILAQLAGIKLHVLDFIRACLQSLNNDIIDQADISQRDRNRVVDPVTFDHQRVVIFVDRINDIVIRGDVLGLHTKSVYGLDDLLDILSVSIPDRVWGEAIGLDPELEQRPVGDDIDNCCARDMD